METAPTVQLMGALALGLRHGIDWDHIAAILDIVGSKSSQTPVLRTFYLALLYSLGHALVVVILGLAALQFAAVLPGWVDTVMERLVGLTLLFLGGWVFYCLSRSIDEKGHTHFPSRRLFLINAVRRAYHRMVGQNVDCKTQFIDEYGARTAFGVGVIHGIGAETGTQVLLIAAVGGTTSHAAGIAMLFAFVVGLVLSNTVVAILSEAGFVTSEKFKPIYLSAGTLAGCFSLVVGSYFLLGKGDTLPDLQHLLRL